MNIHFNITHTAAILMSAAVCLSGCASQKKVAGHWRTHEVTTNGQDDEWQNDIPQFYDKKQHLTIRILNDTKKISLAVSTSAPELQRQLQMSGLTIWIDPQGGKKKVFGLHLQANNGGPSGPPGRRGPGPPGRHRDMPNAKNRPSSQPEKVDQIESVSITYSDTTGPLEMSMEEVRRTGINIGVGQTRDSRLVYEIDIKFSAAPSLEGLKPGMVVGIGVIGAPAGQAGPMGTMGGPPGMHAVPTQFGEDMGSPAKGGRAPGGNAPPRGANGKTFEIWLKVTLAASITG